MFLSCARQRLEDAAKDGVPILLEYELIFLLLFDFATCAP